MASFTLTMWDVKTFQTSSYPSKSLCFTLTMWDVKKIVYTFHCCGFMFYLNYVGCKESSPVCFFTKLT